MVKTQGGDDLFSPKGMPGISFPNNWKGENGLYCAGFAQRGLAGISRDAMNIVNDITSVFTSENRSNCDGRILGADTTDHTSKNI